MGELSSATWLGIGAAGFLLGAGLALYALLRMKWSEISRRNEHGIIQFSSAGDWLGHHAMWFLHWLLLVIGGIVGLAGLYALSQGVSGL